MLSEIHLPQDVVRLSGISNGAGLWNQDHLGLALARLELISRPYNLRWLFGRSSDPSNGVYEHRFVGERPIQTSLMRINGYGRWGAYVQNVKSLFTDWQFKTDSPLLDENDVRHANVLGSVVTGANNRTKYRDYDTLLNPGPFHYYFQVSDDPGFSVSPVESSPLYVPENYLGDLNALRDEVNSGLWDTTVSGGRSMYYFGFDYELGDDIDADTRLVVVYSYTLWNLRPNGFWRQDAYTVRLKYQFIPVPHYADVDTELVLYDHCNYLIVHEADILVYDEVVTPAGTLPSPSWASTPGLQDNFANDGLGGSPIFLNTYTLFYHSPVNSRISDVTGYSEVDDAYSYVTGASLPEFKHRAIGLYSDALILNWFSARDAIDKHFETIGANHIATLLEFKDIAQVLDLDKAILALVNRRKRGFFALLDLLTDVKLLYSFGIAPTLDDAKSTGAAMRAFRKRLQNGNLFRLQTVRGVYSYEVPVLYFPGFENVRIIARSKIRLGLEPDSLLAGIVTARTFGLLPTLTAIWDLIPFSFVVDWFTNLGGLASAAEDSLLMLSLNVPGSVNSLSFEYQFSDYDMQHYGFEVVDDGSLCGYRYYDRFSTGGVPVLTPSRLPVFAAAGVPDWGTAGSLLYKFL